ncbi:MAG: TIGR03560 family F420-dependent LLM class oxidoreductase [Acidimicrobiales bacterium]|nr:TIGR03560 family F420-dependent LLM class oxidoreductase [Acidimicrobiales bacterium]
MRFSYWIPNSLPWDATVAQARLAEELGFDGIWYADHFMPNAVDPADGPIHEAPTMLGALAAATSRVRLGPLVYGNTYRNPAVMLKSAVTIDHISNGRFVLGLGAGWQENEHRAYGLDFNSFRWRFDRLEEACQVITSLLAEGRSTFSGSHYSLVDAPLDPKPVQSPLPILIGGGGEKRTLPIVARYANEWNVWGTPELLAQKGAVLDRCCETQGRDPSTVAHSAVALLFMPSDATVLEKVRSMSIERPTVIGTSSEVTDIMGAYRDAGVGEFIIPGFNFRGQADLEDTLQRFMAEVVPAING